MQDTVRKICIHMNLRSISDISGVSYSKIKHFRNGEQNLKDEDINKVIDAIKNIVGGIF